MKPTRIHRYIAPETGKHHITVTDPYFDDASYYTGTKEGADDYVQDQIDFIDRCNKHLDPQFHIKINFTNGNQ